jgi:hypothetical protein
MCQNEQALKGPKFFIEFGKYSNSTVLFRNERQISRKLANMQRNCRHFTDRKKYHGKMFKNT